MAYDSLCTYLAALEQQARFRWVDTEVDKDWGIGTVVRMIFRAMSEERRYGIGFRNIKGYLGGRVVAGVIGASKATIASAIGSESTADSIHVKVISGLEKPIPPVIVATGPCKEVKLTGDAIDLLALPNPI